MTWEEETPTGGADLGKLEIAIKYWDSIAGEVYENAKSGNFEEAENGAIALVRIDTDIQRIVQKLEEAGV